MERYTDWLARMKAPIVDDDVAERHRTHVAEPSGLFWAVYQSVGAVAFVLVWFSR